VIVTSPFDTTEVLPLWVDVTAVPVGAGHEGVTGMPASLPLPEVPPSLLLPEVMPLVELPLPESPPLLLPAPLLPLSCAELPLPLFELAPLPEPPIDPLRPSVAPAAPCEPHPDRANMETSSPTVGRRALCMSIPSDLWGGGRLTKAAR
jgi:hypothetical protein